jgi:hypothetical protein
MAARLLPPPAVGEGNPSLQIRSALTVQRAIQGGFRHARRLSKPLTLFAL